MAELPWLWPNAMIITHNPLWYHHYCIILSCFVYIIENTKIVIILYCCDPVPTHIHVTHIWCIQCVLVCTTLASGYFLFSGT